MCISHSKVRFCSRFKKRKGFWEGGIYRQKVNRIPFFRREIFTLETQTEIEMNLKMLTGASLALLLLASCQEKTLEERADELHARIFTLDSHNDTPLRFRLPEFDMAQSNEGVCVDLPKMEAGGLDGAFFAAYVRQGARDSAGLEAAQQRVLSLVEDIHRMAETHSDRLALATTPEEGIALKKAGKRAMYIGVENGRTRVEWVSAAEGAKFSQTMHEFVDKITSLGKNVRLEDLRCRN